MPRRRLRFMQCTSATAHDAKHSRMGANPGLPNWLLVVMVAFSSCTLHLASR